MIASRFTTRSKLLKGDFSNPGIETPATAPTMKRISPGLPLPSGSGPRRLPPGLPLPKDAGPRRPPPGFSLPMHPESRRSPPGLPPPSVSESRQPPPDLIGDTVTQLRASIVGCHRETVRRETGLDFCPSSNLHHFVQQSPHSRHEYISPTVQSTLNQSKKTFEHFFSKLTNLFKAWMVRSDLREPVIWFRGSITLHGLGMFSQTLEFLSRQQENSVLSAQFRTPVLGLPVWDFRV